MSLKGWLSGLRARLNPSTPVIPAIVAHTPAPTAIGPPQARELDWLNTREINAARDTLRTDLRTAVTIGQAERMFAQIPSLLEGCERLLAWRRLSQLVADLPADPARDTDASRTILQLRLQLALRDYGGFLTCIQRSGVPPRPWQQKFGRTAQLLQSRAFPDFNAPKLFGIGLSRTGTQSLNHALNILGFNAAHCTNDFTGDILTLDDAVLFDALTGTPVCVMFESLYYLFPNARFIYTARPVPSWVSSVVRHFRQNRLPNSFDQSRERLTMRGSQPFGLQRAIVHGALYHHYPDAEAARRAFDRRVQGFFDARDSARLLRFDLFSGDSWPELCAFLGRPIPPDPFPRDNCARRNFNPGLG
jgi:hypothetical protein